MPSHQTSFLIGSLYPKLTDGTTPNILTSSSLELVKSDDGQWIVQDAGLEGGSLSPAINITTGSVNIPGIDKFLNDFLVPQLTNKNGKSLWVKYHGRLLNENNNDRANDKNQIYYREKLNRTILDLIYIGYDGVLKNYADSTSSLSDLPDEVKALFGPPPEGKTWNDIPVYSGEDDFYNKIYEHLLTDKASYNPAAKWGAYLGKTSVSSDYDLDNLREQINALDNEAASSPNLWRSAMLYTYGTTENGISYPGPVLFVEPGDKVSITFNNDIQIAGLTEEEAQKATLIQNSLPGNSGSDGLAGSTSTNYHLHGAHTFPGGFGDNVVARYTTGQSWTTGIPIPFDHGQGSYWYHPHYHPSVNQQVYAGLTGFMQIGDPLQKIEALQDVPRNLAVIKSMAVDIDSNGELLLTGLDNLGPVANQITMFTVNGEFQPSADAGTGGWQTLTISNQTNQAFFTVSLLHKPSKDSGSETITTLPLWVYGEDGHQYPQIRSASNAGVLGFREVKVTTEIENKPVELEEREYAQATNSLLMVPPGKRLDLLVYLPEGHTEIASLRQFTNEGIVYRIGTTGAYPDLSSANTEADINNPVKGNSAAGPLATFSVTGGTALPTSADALNSFFDSLTEEVATINNSIQVQNILPTTPIADYDSTKVPSVDLFAQENGEDVWAPVRKREFNWTRGVLVGPESEYDLATQQALAEVKAEKEQQGENGYEYKRYTPLPRGVLEGTGEWLGYENPFLINDHVFPSGALNISQLGTIEEWTNWNWSVAQLSAKKIDGTNFGTPERIEDDAQKYIAHPFHIHINDYQVKDSDSGFTQKNNLEDVTALNSSGYSFFDSRAGENGAVVRKDPLSGKFKSIKEAELPETVGTLGTYGANSQTLRMLFQDYIGAYVFHCHILPHEDAGMMLAMLVIENRRDSFVLPTELSGVATNNEGVPEIIIHKADDLTKRALQFAANPSSSPQRTSAGDLNSDFVQDIVIASQGDGLVRIYDGQSLKNSETKLLSTINPFNDSSLAPWVFIGDVSGDNRKDLLTVGFNSQPIEGSLNLQDLTAKSWTLADGVSVWEELFSFDPWDFISLEADPSKPAINNLTTSDISFSTGDYNLDNFTDIALAYRTATGVRMTILDGAAIALSQQTGNFEEGYFPDQSLLADAYIDDEHLATVHKITLSSGFNLYGQGALENLLLTATGSGESTLYTFQLDAGHFIATSMPENGGEMVMDHSSSHSGAVTYAGDSKIKNVNPATFKLHLVDEHDIGVTATSVTPVFTGARGNGGLLINTSATDSSESSLILLNPQGFGSGQFFNGQVSSSSALLDNKQQLIIDVNKLHSTESTSLAFFTSELTPDSRQDQTKLLNLLYRTYLGNLPDPSSAASWQADLSKGLYIDKSITEFVNDFVQSLDATNLEQHFGVDFTTANVEAVVNKTYQTIFGRLPSPSELSFWQSQLSDSSAAVKILPFEILRFSEIAQVAVVAPVDPFISNPDPITQYLDSRNADTDLTVTGTIYRSAAYNNTVGFYRIVNTSGDVVDEGGNVYSPGDLNYKDVALSAFNRLTDTNANLKLDDNKTVDFDFTISKGELFAQFLAVNGSAIDNSEVYFAYAQANSDKQQHVTELSPFTWGWEDLPGLGDKDYNDAIVKYAVNDKPRVKLLGSAANFSNAQWANTANIEGAFGQGLASEKQSFDIVNAQLASHGYIQSDADSELAYNSWKNDVVKMLGGVELSNEGFF